MQPTLTRCATLALAVSLASSLAACGGGHDDAMAPAPEPGNAVPASATVSAKAYSRFAASLEPSETAAPLDLRGVTPPRSETDDPIPVT